MLGDDGKVYEVGPVPTAFTGIDASTLAPGDVPTELIVDENGTGATVFTSRGGTYEEGTATPIDDLYRYKLVGDLVATTRDGAHARGLGEDGGTFSFNSVDGSAAPHYGSIYDQLLPGQTLVTPAAAIVASPGSVNVYTEAGDVLNFGPNRKYFGSLFEPYQLGPNAHLILQERIVSAIRIEGATPDAEPLADVMLGDGGGVFVITNPAAASVYQFEGSVTEINGGLLPDGNKIVAGDAIQR